MKRLLAVAALGAVVLAGCGQRPPAAPAPGSCEDLYRSIREWDSIAKTNYVNQGFEDRFAVDHRTDATVAYVEKCKDTPGYINPFKYPPQGKVER